MWETQETQVQSLGQEDHLEEEMATHSSTLAQRIPWTEEPGELLAMVSQHSDRMRLSHSWAHEHIMVTVKGRDPEGLHRLSTWRRLQQREGTSLVASTVKNLAAMTGDLGSILGSGKSPGERNGFSLQYSCLQNSTDRGGLWATWWATGRGVGKSWTRLRD